MTALIRAISTLSRFCGGIAATLVIAILALTCHMAVLRYGYGLPATWQAELVTYLMIALTSLAAPYVLATRGHVNMDVLPRHAGRPLRAVLGVLAGLVSLVFCAGMTWAGLDLLAEAITEGWRADAVWGIGLWLPYVALPVGLGLLALQVLADILAYVSGREPTADGPARGDDEA